MKDIFLKVSTFQICMPVLAVSHRLGAVGPSWVGGWGGLHHSKSLRGRVVRRELVNCNFSN